LLQSPRDVDALDQPVTGDLAQGARIRRGANGTIQPASLDRVRSGHRRATGAPTTAERSGGSLKTVTDRSDSSEEVVTSRLHARLSEKDGWDFLGQG
jgi:hypothetical protein